MPGNNLGKIWMSIRDELQTGNRKPGQVAQQAKRSKELDDTLKEFKEVDNENVKGKKRKAV